MRSSDRIVDYIAQPSVIHFQASKFDECLGHDLIDYLICYGYCYAVRQWIGRVVTKMQERAKREGDEPDKAEFVSALCKKGFAQLEAEFMWCLLARRAAPTVFHRVVWGWPTWAPTVFRSSE